MAYDTSALTNTSVLGGIRKEIITRANNPTSNRGLFYIEGSVATTPTDYDTNGDHMELCQFPDNCRLLGVWVSSDTSLDSHATPTVENDIALASTAHAITTTLVESSTLLRTAAAVVSWGGSATFGENEFPGLDVSNLWLALVTDASAATPATTATISFGALVYLGGPVALGAG